MRKSINMHYKALDQNVSGSENNLLIRCQYASIKHSVRTLRPQAKGWGMSSDSN